MVEIGIGGDGQRIAGRIATQLLGIRPVRHAYNRTQLLHMQHRRSIQTEVKAKFVTAVWGEEFIKFVAEQAILH